MTPFSDIFPKANASFQESMRPYVNYKGPFNTEMEVHTHVNIHGSLLLLPGGFNMFSVLLSHLLLEPKIIRDE